MHVSVISLTVVIKQVEFGAVFVQSTTYSASWDPPSQQYSVIAQKTVV